MSAVSIHHSHIGPLTTIEVLPSTGHYEQTVILLHGYGASAEDLASLPFELEALPNIRWIFPQAPHELEMEGQLIGRQWFPIDPATRERAWAYGEPFDFASLRPQGLDEATALVLKMLEHLDLDKPLTLGGFSQGAMVATDALLIGTAPCHRLAIFSGALVDKAAWGKSHVGDSRDIAFFQSHGTKDAILPFSGAQALEATLQKAGLHGHLLSFSGGHSIPSSALAAFSSFLGKDAAFP